MDKRGSANSQKTSTPAKSKEAWEDAYNGRFRNSSFGNDAIGLFALGLQYNLEDLDAIGAESVVGGNNDKKCDIFYLDKEEGRCIIAQCYLSAKARAAAPANKASDLNTAIAWLLATPLNEVPEELRANAAELRRLIKNDELAELGIWYVHNWPESKNVIDELRAVEHAANSSVRHLNADSNAQVFGREFGSKQFPRLYHASGSPILVTSDIKATVADGYLIQGSDWSAYQTYVSGALIYGLFAEHKTDLFSANVRDYLGSRESDANINNGIKETAIDSPDNFWVYNNGITALVNALKVRALRGKKRLLINGISIVNGAQTTGAIGTLEKRPTSDLMVPMRFIWTANKSRVEDIIRYNNSQNKISASDFRSTDSIQKGLKDEFRKIPDAEYEGGRRGSGSDVIKRRPNLLPSYSVGQALAAFHGDPVVAYDRKSEIWINSQTYSSYFKEETTAKHIVFAYSLFRTVGQKKLELIGKQKNGLDLTQTEQEQLKFFEKKGAILLICAAMSACLEAVLDKPIPNKFRLSFGDRVSPKKAESFWSSLCLPLLPLTNTLDTAFSANRISTELVKRAIPQFRNVVHAVANPNKEEFDRFASKVRFD